MQHFPDRASTPTTKRRLEARIKHELILAKERELLVKSLPIDDKAVADAEKRWHYLINNRMSPTYTRSVNLKEHLIEAIFLQRFYPLIRPLGQMSCRKTRKSKKSELVPYQLISSFIINDIHLAYQLFPTFSEMNSCPDIDADTSILFWYFDIQDQPLKLEYNWTMQELTVSFTYRIFRRCIINGVQYLDEL